MQLQSSRKQITGITELKGLVVIVPSSLMQKHKMRRTDEEANYLLVSIKIAFTYTDEEMFTKIFKTCIRPKLKWSPPVGSPHF